LRDSPVAEMAILLLAYGGGYLSLKSLAIPVSTWYAIPTGATFTLTPAGWWFVFFCVPLFQFFVLRWIWRLFLWGQFLWRMLKSPLELIPTHPDEAAGLRFIGEAHRFFSVILLAGSISMAGVLADEIVYGKISLPHFAPFIAIYVIVCVGIVLLSLTIFVPTLVQTKRAGLYKCGSLATEYASSFDRKWIKTKPSHEETLLGTADIQSLADLGNSYSFIEKMGSLPMDYRTPINFVIACLIPMVSLLLTMIPLKDVVKMLIKFVL
jgi:hypothetical protein